MADFQTKFNVEIEGLDKLLAKIKAFGERAVPELERAMNQSVLLVEATAKANAPWNFGQLRGSISGQVTRAAGTTVEGAVGSNLVYAASVEFGQRAHFPPVERIELWVRRKFQMGEDESGPVAYLVARKIASSGTEPDPYLIPAFKTNQPLILKAFHMALLRLLGGG